LLLARLQRVPPRHVTGADDHDVALADLDALGRDDLVELLGHDRVAALEPVDALVAGDVEQHGAAAERLLLVVDGAAVGAADRLDVAEPEAVEHRVGVGEVRQAVPLGRPLDRHVDVIDMAIQGSTQWDGLSHFAYADAMFNGFWLGNVETIGGAHRCSIHNQKETLCGRAVLLDVARHKGVDRLEGGYAIMPEEPDEVIAAEGVEIREGDIMIVRTGHVPWWYTLQTGEEK